MRTHPSGRAVAASTASVSASYRQGEALPFGQAKSRLRDGSILISLCTVAITSNEAPEWIELIPAGKFSAVDGRGPFLNEDPEGVVAASIAKMPQVGLVLDYDHSTDLAAPEGRPAPAAGWLKQFKVENGAIFARIEWTHDAAEALREKKYRYVSPVFEHDKAGHIERILRAALTNNPALTELPAIASARPPIPQSLSPVGAGERDLRAQTMAEWDTAYVDDLPDSAFAYIEPGGKKDSEGKTVPRSKRHFPLKNKDGKLDAAHVRNALSRAPQSLFGCNAIGKIGAAAKRLGIGEEKKASAMARKELDAAADGGEKSLSEIVAGLEELFPQMEKKQILQMAMGALDGDDDFDLDQHLDDEDGGEQGMAANPAGEDPSEGDDAEQMARRHAEEMARCASDGERAEMAKKHAAEKERFARRKAAVARQVKGLEVQNRNEKGRMAAIIARHPMVVQMANQLNQMRADQAKAEATQKVDAAIRDGRLIPSQREWAIAYCASDSKGFEKFIGAQPKILQTGSDGTFTGRIGEPLQGAAMLNRREIEICTNLGLESNEQLEKFAANKEKWTLKFPRPRLMLDDSNSGRAEGGATK
jgi:phage I-like protein